MIWRSVGPDLHAGAGGGGAELDLERARAGRRLGQPAVSNLTHELAIIGVEPSALAWGTRVTTITGSGWTLLNSPLCA